MNTRPKLSIALLTCQRTEIALRTVLGIINYLDYEGATGWYIAVDSDNYDHAMKITETLAEHGQHLIGQHCQKFVPGTTHAGASWNLALKECMDWSDFVLWMEDDWILPEKLDIHPFIDLLVEREDIGMVRLGGMAVGSDLHSVGYDGIHYLEYLDTQQYAYSGNPHIRHKRFVEAYGYYTTDRNPGEMELDMDHAVRSKEEPKPKIWWPMTLGGWGVFQHVGKEKTF